MTPESWPGTVSCHASSPFGPSRFEPRSSSMPPAPGPHTPRDNGLPHATGSRAGSQRPPRRIEGPPGGFRTLSRPWKTRSSLASGSSKPGGGCTRPTSGAFVGHRHDHGGVPEPQLQGLHPTGTARHGCPGSGGPVAALPRSCRWPGLRPPRAVHMAGERDHAKA